MIMFRCGAIVALVSFVLTGCAATPFNKPMSAQVAAAIQPADLQIGIKQPELYAEFDRSMIAATSSATCGAVPALGVLLGAACGGAMGAVDATINAERAKTADQMVRPLKDAMLDVKYDQMFNDAIAKSLQGVPSLKFSSVKLTKTVDDKTYEQTFRAATSSAVMFINVDYHISSDFSTLEVSSRGLVFPRSEAARTAAGLAPQLPEQGKEAVLALGQAAYRVRVIYRGELSDTITTPAARIATWKADNAHLLHIALNDGAMQIGRLLAEDIQRGPDAGPPVLDKIDAGKGVKGDLLAKGEGTQLIRLSNGTLIFKAVIGAPLQQTDKPAMVAGS